MKQTNKYFRYAAITAGIYAAVVLVVSVATYMWLGSTRELVQGHLRAIAIGTIVVFVWQGNAIAEKILFWVFLVLSFLVPITLTALAVPDFLEGRPYPTFDKIAIATTAVAVFATLMLTLRARNETKPKS